MDLQKRPWNDRMRILRQAARISQMELAAAAGVNHRQYWRWESGQYKPNENQQDLIAAKLNYPKAVIFGGGEEHK